MFRGHHAFMERIILASSSPRRSEILASLGISFVQLHPEIDESVCDSLVPELRVAALAELKALAALQMASTLPELDAGPEHILAADTLVALRHGRTWKTIGKPLDREDAGTMLRALAGKTHSVFTGLCLLDRTGRHRQTSTCESRVRFSTLTEEEIEGCLDTGEWKGAAGAYRIQGFGSCIVEELKGSWSCVVGLPIRELYAMLGSAGIGIMRPHRALGHPLDARTQDADSRLDQGKGA